ncbi:hypothetical protein E2C01_081271 [Portunus trituberculatus]|uniref:Uncharacterized protein n=1 Tax=Portunus trituberculatus TaxID=210409 RepID=A0A5B7IVU3_PORTR|nr:hypothetical protein [Portunus trituberculatus]
MVEIIKSAKLRCKEYRAHKSMYEEDMDSILDEDKRIDCSLRFVVQLLPSLFKENEQYLLVQSYEVTHCIIKMHIITVFHSYSYCVIKFCNIIYRSIVNTDDPD